MTNQEAIRTLMLSPIYFRLIPLHRKNLIQEYCALFDEVNEKRTCLNTRCKGDSFITKRSVANC